MKNKNKMELFKRFCLGLTIFLIILPGGTYAYSYLEGWDYLDSLYFTVVTVTTIGYGDLVPQTDAGKIFTMIFPFIGIAMAFYFFSIIGNHVFKKTFESKLKEHHEKLVKHFKTKNKKKYQPKKR